MFTVLMVWSLYGSAITRVHSVHVMNAEQRQVAIDLWTKPTR